MIELIKENYKPVIFAVMLAIFFSICTSDVDDNKVVVIKDTKTEDSLKTVIQVQRIQLIHDSLDHQRDVYTNIMLSDYIKQKLDHIPLEGSEVDSIIKIAKQNQFL